MKTKTIKKFFGIPLFTIVSKDNIRDAFFLDAIHVARKIISERGVCLYILGVKVFQKETPLTLFDKEYSKRFEGITHEKLKFLVLEQYAQYMGKPMDINNPLTFNEKLCWMKIYYHDPRMTTCADKVKGRDFVVDNVDGIEEHLVRQYGVYSDVKEIDFSKLPNTFVLKSNWGSGAQIIVDDKSAVDIEDLKLEMETWLKPSSNHYYCAFEYGYKNIVPKIVCEEFLDFEHKIEFFCFNGKPIYFWIIYNDKTSNVSADFYTMDFQKIPLRHKYPNTGIETKKPNDFDEMVDVSKKLSCGFPFVRIDFYKTKTSWFFCEMTFVHWAGLMPFTPESYDLEFGKHILLPEPQIEPRMK